MENKKFELNENEYLYFNRLKEKAEREKALQTIRNKNCYLRNKEKIIKKAKDRYYENKMKKNERNDNQ